MDQMLGANPEYEAFVDKFKPKLTTDDCYTPENVYNAVLTWVFARYGLPDDTPVVRPFWPGGDYKRYKYPENCVVIDNPPFSRMSEIETFYLKNGIRFFLFAHALTIFKPYEGLHYVLTDNNITYENGAVVPTAFVTDMGEYLVEVSAELHKAVEKADRENRDERVKKLPKYENPPEIATAAKLRLLAGKGVSFAIKENDAAFIRSIDSMKAKGKALFGGGFLMSEKAAAKKENVIIWQLNDKEREMVRKLGN